MKHLKKNDIDSERKEKIINEQIKNLAKSLDDNFLILTKDRGWVLINELDNDLKKKKNKIY